MFIQVTGGTTNPLLSGLTGFATLMAALSVASERVTETIKQWVSPWLAKLNPARSAAATQCLAVLSGILVTVLSGQNPINLSGSALSGWVKDHQWLTWVVAGILVSGGSAFWNNLLDILQAAKVQKETTANAALPAAKQIPA